MLALDRVQRGSVQFLTLMSQYICHATSASRKAGRLSTNTAQSVDRLSTNKADHTKFKYSKLQTVSLNYVSQPDSHYNDVDDQRLLLPSYHLITFKTENHIRLWCVVTRDS